MKTLGVHFAIPLAAALPLALVAAGCGGDTPSPMPTQPSVLQPPAPPPAPMPEPVGRSIAVGEIITAAVTSDDAICEYPDPGDPDEAVAGACQRFVVAAPGEGTLGVRVAWDGHGDSIFLAVGSHLYACCGSPLLARVPVAGGSSYTVDVVRSHVRVGGTESIRFELTTWMD